MDDNAFRATWREVNPIPCAFEKALVSRNFRCAKAVWVNVAERETLGCATEELASACADLLQHLRHKAVFALHLTHADGVLPHAKEMKVQVGGLQGVQSVLAPQERTDDAQRLVAAARERFGDWQALPYGEIVKAIAAFTWRRR